MKPMPIWKVFARRVKDSAQFIFTGRDQAECFTKPCYILSNPSYLKNENWDFASVWILFWTTHSFCGQYVECHKDGSKELAILLHSRNICRTFWDCPFRRRAPSDDYSQFARMSHCFMRIVKPKLLFFMDFSDLWNRNKKLPREPSQLWSGTIWQVWSLNCWQFLLHDFGVAKLSGQLRQPVWDW